MMKRLLTGLILGAVVGVAVAAALVAGLKVVAFTGTFGALLAYASAAGTGVLVGLVAGKPIWAGEAKVEGGLKAFFGALLAAGAMFALRRWAPSVELDLTALHAGGPGPLADLPAASLPLISAVLGMFFELDNSVTDAGPGERGRKRVAPGESASRSRVSSSETGVEDGEEDASAGSRRARR
ncbi:MAG: hypothetical protein ACRENE_18655 [Polyangiaceae bacterium]